MMEKRRFGQVRGWQLVGLLLSGWLWACAALGQVRVSGTIADAETKQPVARATVLIQHSGRGVIADDKGNFSLPAAPTDTLIFQALGYAARRLVVGNSGLAQIILQIKLSRASIELQNVDVREGRPSDAAINRFLRNMRRPVKPPVSAVKRPPAPRPLFPVDSAAPLLPKATIQSPLSLLYDQFSREGKERRKLEELQMRDRAEAARKARQRYNKNFLDNRGYE